MLNVTMMLEAGLLIMKGLPPIDEIPETDNSNEGVDSSTSMSFSPTIVSTPKGQNEVQKPHSSNDVYPT